MRSKPVQHNMGWRGTKWSSCNVVSGIMGRLGLPQTEIKGNSNLERAFSGPPARCPKNHPESPEAPENPGETYALGKR